MTEATRWVRTAVDTGLPCPILIERDPLLEPLRKDGGFTALQRYVRDKRLATLGQVPRSISTLVTAVNMVDDVLGVASDASH